MERKVDPKRVEWIRIGTEKDPNGIQKPEQAGTTSGTETDPELSRKGSPPGASGRAVGIQFGSDSIPFRVPLGAFSGVPF